VEETRRKEWGLRIGGERRGKRGGDGRDRKGGKVYFSYQRNGLGI
jgi:hypothetical protein